MKQLTHFPSEDGHIESILIGLAVVKVSFQTWDGRMLVLIYRDVEEVTEAHSVFGDIGEYRIRKQADQSVLYYFYDSNDADKVVLKIHAGSVQIFEVGAGADMNAALFDVGYGYIGGQNGYEQG